MVRFGGTELPAGQVATLRRAIRLEWVTIGFLVVAVALVGAVLGNSQAMKAAWIEDLLSFAPPIGTVELFGQVFWLGWLMIGAMVVTGVPPVLLGRAKLRLAQDLHDKVLYADAKMNKADWLTAGASTVGITGIGLGWWWADAVAALVISGSILGDGVTNVRGAVRGLMDVRATTYDGKQPHPLLGRVDDYLGGLDWVRAAGSRVRDEGHVFHVESFVVPRDPAAVSLDTLDRAGRAVMALDWKVQDVVLVPVPELPAEVVTSRS